MNSTVNFLDSIKENTIQTYEHYSKNKFSRDFKYFNDNVSPENFLKARQIIRAIAKQKNIEVPIYIERNRSMKELLEDLGYESGFGQESYNGVISTMFNTFSSYIEDNMYEVKIVEIKCDVPKNLTFENIKRDLNNCEIRIESNDFTGAITSSKTLVEGVCKEILLLVTGKTIEDNVTLPKLFNIVSKHLNLDPSNESYDKSLKEIVSGLNKIIHGLSEVRNTAGDSHSKNVNPSFHHAVLAVNAAKTITSFLFHTYEYQREKRLLNI